MQYASMCIGNILSPHFSNNATDLQKAMGMVIETPYDLAWATGFMVIDFPLSLVADTLTLPITVPATIERGSWFPRPDSKPAAKPDAPNGDENGSGRAK